MFEEMEDKCKTLEAQNLESGEKLKLGEEKNEGLKEAFNHGAINRLDAKKNCDCFCSPMPRLGRLECEIKGQGK